MISFSVTVENRVFLLLSSGAFLASYLPKQRLLFYSTVQVCLGLFGMPQRHFGGKKNPYPAFKLSLPSLIRAYKTFAVSVVYPERNQQRDVCVVERNRRSCLMSLLQEGATGFRRLFCVTSCTGPISKLHMFQLFVLLS